MTSRQQEGISSSPLSWRVSWETSRWGKRRKRGESKRDGAKISEARTPVGTFRSPTICQGDKAISPLRAITPSTKREFVRQLRRCHRSKLFEDWMSALLLRRNTVFLLFFFFTFFRRPNFSRVLYVCVCACVCVCSKREKRKLNLDEEGEEVEEESRFPARKRSQGFQRDCRNEGRRFEDRSTGNPAKSRRLQISCSSRRNRYTQEEWLPHPAKRQTPLLPLTQGGGEIKNKG